MRASNQIQSLGGDWDCLVYNKDVSGSKKAIDRLPKPSVKRGRPREFDREEKLRVAMQVFWRLGYEATSMADLRAALSITQASLYAAYGSKEALFREAVDLYRRTDGDTTSRALASDRPVRDAVHAVLQDAVNAFTKPGAPGGCLVVLGTTNCSVENKSVQDYLVSLRLETAKDILLRLKRARRDGEIKASAPVDAVAAYYTTVLHGLSIQARDGASRKVLTRVVDCAMAAWPTLTRR